jgi:hypothetical protein
VQQGRAFKKKKRDKKIKTTEKRQKNNSRAMTAHPCQPKP